MPTAAGGPIGQLLSYPALTIFLEELPQEGVHLQRLYRYARGLDGSLFNLGESCALVWVSG